MRSATHATRDGLRVRPGRLDRFLRPVHRWVFRDARRRAHKLLRFAETEADGGRDLSRAAELTSDVLLRKLYLRHANDEQRHAALFRKRGAALLATLPITSHTGATADWLAPGERGLDDLKVEKDRDAALLAFLHLSEKAAAQRFAIYEQVIDDPPTREVFSEILADEVFHMNYTYAQLKRVAPRLSGRRLFLARLGRLWKGYLRIASALASVIGGVMLTAQYFIVLPLFALLAKREARREPLGFSQCRPPRRLESQY